MQLSPSRQVVSDQFAACQIGIQHVGRSAEAAHRMLKKAFMIACRAAVGCCLNQGMPASGT